MYKPMLSNLSNIADNWICNIEGAVQSWNSVNYQKKILGLKPNHGLQDIVERTKVKINLKQNLKE